MIPLLLLGGGGHCRSCIDVIEAEGRYRVHGILDPAGGGPILGYGVLGGDGELAAALAATPNALVTVGQIKSPAIRIRLYEAVKHAGGALPVIASPRAHVSRHAAVGEGTVVMHGAVVNAGARIGVNGIINTMALVEHDAVVGDHCHVSTGARINGGVTVEDHCFIGSGVTVRDGITIGRGSVIGAGCILLRDVKPGSLIISRRI